MVCLAFVMMTDFFLASEIAGISDWDSTPLGTRLVWRLVGARQAALLQWNENEKKIKILKNSSGQKE